MSYCFSTSLVSKKENQQNMVLLISILTLLKELKTAKKLACIFLDFAKAFHTVNSEILLKKTTSLWREGDSTRTVSVLPFQ